MERYTEKDVKEFAKKVTDAFNKFLPNHLKFFNRGDVVLLDNSLEVEVITPESNVLIKDSRDGTLRWVEKERLKHKKEK